MPMKFRPPEAGGDTPYAGMYAAYDGLDESLKQRLQGMTAVHSYEQRWQKDAQRGMARAQLDDSDVKKIPEVSHPIVRAHPITGRLALYVNEGFTVRIEGVSENESQTLLEELFAHSAENRFTYTHRWQAHDLIMWDNALCHSFRHMVRPHLRSTHASHYHRRSGN